MKKGIKFTALTALSISAVAVAHSPQASAAEAVPAGFYDIEGNGFTSIADFKKLSKAEKQKLFKNANVYIVTNTGVVSAIDGISASNEELKSKTVTVEKFQEDKKVNLKEISSGDIKVNKVSAITAAMDVNGGQLEFAINGKSEAADVAALEEAGYTVEYKVSSGATADANGIVSDITGSTFRYAVEVLNADGEVVATSATVTVTVQDYSATVTELNDITLSVGGNALTVNNVSKGDTAVKVDVFGKTKATTGAVDVNLSTNKAVKFSSSKNAIATVDASGNVSLTGAVGEVTITAKSGDLTKSVTFKVVADAREVDTAKSTVSATTIKDAVGATVEFTVTLKDQYGEAITGGASNLAFAKEGVVSSTVREETDNKGTYTVTATLLAKTTATQDVAVTYNGTALTTIKVVKISVVEPSETTSYAISAATTKLDLFNETKSKTTLTVVGKDANGYTSETVALKDLVIKPTDKTVVTVDENGVLTGKKAGSTTVKVYKKDGNLEDYIGEVKIEVIDSKPTLSSASIKSIGKQDGTTSVDLAKIVTLGLGGSGNYEDVVFSFSGTDIYADLDGEGELEAIKVGNIIVTGTTGVSVSNNQLVFDLATAVDSTTELTITDLNGAILSENTFVLDVVEDEDEDEGEE